MPIPSASPTLGFPIPPDCKSLDPNIDISFYGKYDFKSIPCEYLSISPDGLTIAFVTLVKVSLEVDNDGIRRAVKIFKIPSSETIQIYESKAAFLYPEWSPTGHLVISDVPYDVGNEYTAIYNLARNKIITTLDGAVRRSYRDYWAFDKNAFFVLSPNLFGPVCDENLSGYNLLSEKSLPIIKPITPGTNLYVVIGQPIWKSGTRILVATIRDGICLDEDKQDCQYKNSYIVSIDLSDPTPEIIYLFYDSAIDYSLRQTEQGTIEIDAIPSHVISCWEANE